MKKISLGILVLFTFCFIGCSNQSSTTNSLPWEVSTPKEVGIDEAAIDSIDHDIHQGEYGLVDHFMLIRNGKIAVDNHYTRDYKTISQDYDTTNHQYNYDHPAWHPYYNNTELHSLQSVSKTVTSILIGIARDEGFPIYLDSAILPMFKEHNIDMNDKLKMSITLRDLLTMQSGISWDESSAYADDSSNNCTIMELEDDWIQYVLDRPMDTIPGTKFVYNSGVTMLLGKLLSMATGQSVDKWAEEKLFKPLGIMDYYWKKTPFGEVDAEGGLYLKPHDLARIGYMVLQKGKWKDQQIVSEDWLNQSVQPAVVFNDNSGYGFQWWLGLENGKPVSYNMRGYGGQFVNVIPADNMVLVSNGWNIHSATRRRMDGMFSRIHPNDQ